ncbi:hypothetical protein [Ewingella americana]|jgi:hypothetical protein|uniref:Lipoprotein n=1 Tax=Ewingella americana TaxID=41202 RepID=A0A502GPH2_9GAMM|nr:hypothetical protein [Ewingella americana]TPG63170.1 hypothetical protein EAH77_06190 [Ewingella americana]
MKFICVLVVAVSVLAGCSSIDKPVGDVAYRPLNASGIKGEASYTTSFIAPLERSFREATFKKIYDFCGGKYDIMGESNDGREVHLSFLCTKNLVPSGAIYINRSNGATW